MIRCANQIRLHPNDTVRLARITGAAPQVASVEALNRYVEVHCKSLDATGTPEARLLSLLLQDEKITSEPG